MINFYIIHSEKFVYYNFFVQILGANAGPNPNACSWTYANHGYQLECGRNDEIIAGRCGSGEHNDCPNDSSHGILCCEFTVYE